VHECVDKILDRLSSRQEAPAFGVVAHQHEGGIIWLFREVHESVYEALTENLHTNAWRKALQAGRVKGRGPELASRAAALLDSLLCIAWHSAIARTYYADVFLPTRDINAFYEYLYHRVSYIRMTTLVLAITYGQGNELWQAAHDNVERLREQAGEERGAKERAPLPWFLAVFGIFAPQERGQSVDAGHEDKVTNLTKLRQALERLREHALETLHKALVRDRNIMRSMAAPDTVLAWSQEFIRRELPLIRGEPFREVDPLLASDIDPKKDGAITITRLADFFEELRFKAHLSKPSFVEARRQAEDLCKEFLGGNSGCRVRPDAPESGGDADGTLAKELARALRQSQHEREQLGHAVCWLITCAYHLGDEATASTLVRVLEEACVAPPADRGPLPPELKVNRRRLLELKCKACLGKWPFWQPLADLSPMLENPETRKKDLAVLRSAEATSIEYESLIRETCDNPEEDARHRSCALALRSRSLYLRYQFGQAHHWLDRASAGLGAERVDHRVAVAVIHACRAELLALSANHHYERRVLDPDKADNGTAGGEPGRRTQTDVDCALKKIERAEAELMRADIMLSAATHQNLYRIRVDLGWAQLRIERLLFEFERGLLAETGVLSATEYSQRNGAVEQLILDGMRRLRSVLDHLPFVVKLWLEVEKDKEQGQPLVQTERMVYKLWRQLFVIGAFFSALLHEQHNRAGRDGGIATALAYLVRGSAKDGDMPPFTRRWSLWCEATRFDRLAHPSIPLGGILDESLLQDGYSRRAVKEIMKKACKEELMNELWNDRRKPGNP
jgi:hypothetical protein